MKQHNNAHKRLYHSWQRQLPYITVSCLGSFSFLSSGLVFAQTQSAVDSIVPVNGNAVPKSTIERIKTNVTPEKTPQEPEFSQKKLIHKLHSNLEISQSTSIRKLKADLEQHKVQVEITTPPTSHHATSSVSVNTVNSISKDYNNAYIDPTDYSSRNKVKYEAPSSVVITERSSGCKTILAQSVSGNLCANSSKRQPIASDSENPHTKAPTWLKKSENVHLASVSVTKSEPQQSLDPVSRNLPNSQNNTLSSIKNNIESHTDHLADRVAGNDPLHLNRFIPKASEFNPTTTVSSVPIAPSGGTLPPPVTADNLVPRPSLVAYNIPLASALPQIAFGGRFAYGNGSGMLFPLSIPAPITSFFGWRVHPITGDNRFHSGIDLGASTGTPILAAYSGNVEVADAVSGYGLAVILNHNNAEQTLYGHMSQILVRPGQWVQQGTIIGLVGSTGMSTGPHLHFEVRHLTAQGWVAVDPSNQLESSLNQFTQARK